VTGNSLYYGDNLVVLRESIASESVDLVYLDPPFNSRANYNLLFRSSAGAGSQAQIEAFDDTWHWGSQAEAAFDQVIRFGNTNVADLLRAMRSFLGENDVMAYLAMMCVRLLELHRVLKQTGCLYLHCDPSASHYLKVDLDQIFRVDRFQAEIIWQRTATHNDAKRWPWLSDTILFYSKSEAFHWKPLYRAQHEDAVAMRYRFIEPDGRRFRLGPMDAPAGGRNVRHQ
jgi:adenine specific DNA methylase Mod